MIADLLRRVRAHGRDGDIPALIEMAWSHARHGRWDACERAVHNLQVRHPDALWALVYDVCDRVIERFRDPVSGRTPLVALVDDAGVGVPSAWLVLCRALDADVMLRAELAPLSPERQREAAVALLRYAACVTREVAR